MEQQQVKKEKVKFYLERDGFLAETAVILMVLSALFRLIGCWGLWGDKVFAITQIILPICCNVLFILCIIFLGKRLFSLSAIPVVLGAVFLIVGSFGYERWINTALCILLCIVVTVLYGATVFGRIRTKWLLVPVCALCFLYRLLIVDVAAMRNEANPVTFASGMQELSILCIVLALACTGFALKKKKPEAEPQLPKIKDPIVVAPVPRENTEKVNEQAATVGEQAETDIPEQSAEPTEQLKTDTEDTAGDTV